MSERLTESVFEDALIAAGYSKNDWEFQGSADPEIQRLLPSKGKGQDGKGRPEFIVRLNGDAADLLVVECKTDRAAHASAPNLTEISKLKAVAFAEDGVLSYMKGLRREYNIVGLAVSGTEAPLQITTFRVLRGGAIERLPNRAVLPRADYTTILRNTTGYGSRTEAEIQKFSVALHIDLRDHMELSETNKPLIVSAILLGLMEPTFEAGYRDASDNDGLADSLLTAIRSTLKRNKLAEKKREAMMSDYAFIQSNQAVKEHLKPTIAKIYRNLFFALHSNSSIDLLGHFYGEFLRYSGGDKKGLGIVLTPRHITELFADLADLDPRSSVVLDLCAGTGGFLISAMAKMIHDAAGDSAVIEDIKNKRLIGVELEPHVFTLACANMIFRGDGKANMFLDDSLNPRDRTDSEHKGTEDALAALAPNVALLNPPYSKTAADKHELVFIKRALDLLRPGGICIAILPLGAISSDNKAVVQLKKEILEKHSLRASMSMPPQLFPTVGAVTAIVVFEAGRPHCREESQQVLDGDGNPVVDETGRPRTQTIAVAKRDSWFAYWRDDGFTLSKGKRVERVPGTWAGIKKDWLEAYNTQRETRYWSYKHKVTHEDEWLAEQFMETDFSALTPGAFEEVLRHYAVFRLTSEVAPEEVASDEAVTEAD